MHRVSSILWSARSMSTSSLHSAAAASKEVQRVPRLPRLPIPPLKDTLKRYLESLEPFLKEDAASGGQPFEEAMRQRVAWATEFEEGLGPVLQQRLIDLDRASPNNWLDDNFWLKKAYLEWRAPLIINSNWWLAFENDPGVPLDVLNGGGETRKIAGLGMWQIRRAAWLLHRFLDFRQRICSQELYPETTRTGLWVRSTTPKMFNVCRIPRHDCDQLTTPRPDSPFSRTVTVLVRNWVYAVNVLSDDGTPVDFVTIEDRLSEIAVDVEARLEAGESTPPISLLTSSDRDTWASNREYLLTLSDSNRRTMSAIEDSIMALCFDHHTLNDGWASGSREEIKTHLENIRSGNGARNRWFDKTLSLIVESNSRAGLMGEHSPCDALLPSIVADYALVQAIDADSRLIPGPADVSRKSREWQRLDWKVDETIAQQCEEVATQADAIISDSDYNVFSFSHFGSDSLKRSKVSPDAFVQLAMQLAWYRAKGSFTATYETALTRLFHHGRTETIRTFSNEARSFVLAMMDKRADTTSRHELLMKALHHHARLTKNAALGRGIDRHLLGLSLVTRKSEHSALLSDEYYLKSQQWKLSTSGLTAGIYFRGTGFGSPYTDGYGINYLIAPTLIRFCIESKYQGHIMASKEFFNLVASSLVEMKQTLELDMSIDHSYA